MSKRKPTRKPKRSRLYARQRADMPLTDREQRFVTAFIVKPHAAEAAKTAGYHARSPAYFRQIAFSIRNKPNVAAEIARRMAVATRKADISVTDVLIGLKELAFANMADFLEEDEATGLPRFKKLSALTREQMAALSEVTVDEVTEGKGEAAEAVRRIRFKLHNKRDALVDLGRYLKMFVEAQGANAGPSHTTNNIVVIQNALSATDGILERILAGGTLESVAATVPDGPLLPVEVHSPPA